jgi:hypothetical protein
MIEKRQDAIKGNRIFFLGNLRTFMIFLVFFLHAGLVYEKSGFPAPWWIVFDPSTSDLPGLLFFIMDFLRLYL